MNNGRPVIACVCGLPNKALGSTDPQAAPLVPPVPEQESGQYSLEFIEELRKFIEELRTWGPQCAEIAQAGARIVRDANEWANLCNAQLERNTAELEVTLAQRDREVLGLTEALGKVREEIGGCLERDAAAFMRMTLAESDSWDIARHNQSHGYVLDTIKAALATTAQAGADAEQRIRDDERSKIESVRSDLEDLLDIAGRELCTDEQYERLRRVKAAILGTESGEGPDLSKCPKCGGPADNGHDRCLPPSPYFCSKCSGESDEH
jgi:hypothetical protein